MSFLIKQEVSVEGMKCEHCEAHMEEAFMKIDGVKSAKADRNKNLVTVESEKGVSEKTAEETVTSLKKTYKGLKTL